jgi:Zn-dependent protease with chaperone function
LLPYLLLAVLFTAVALYLLCIATYAIVLPFVDAYRAVESLAGESDAVIRFVTRLWIPELLYAVFAVTILTVIAGSVYKFHQLRKGGSVVALALGGRRIDPQTEHTDERRLLNVIEEMSIASSTPMPDVYVLDYENAINAFAAGHSTDDMVIGVTHGCLRVLNRDELQGVVAHEFSHILNGDVPLNMRLIGIVHGLYCFTLMAYAMMAEAKDREVEDKTLLEIFIDIFRGCFGFVLAFIGFNGAFFARLIKSAICREREFLADAAAVQFTRYPDGLAGALKKAEAWAIHRIVAPAAEEVSHIFFNNVRDDDQFRLTSTHPPVGERVHRLDPGFYKSVEPSTFKAEEVKPIEQRPEAAPTSGLIALENVLSAVPVPTNEHLAAASRLLAALPSPVTQASRKPESACALVYTLLLTNDSAAPASRLQSVGVDSFTAERAADLLPVVRQLELQAKLPLVEISLPALRRLSAEQFILFNRAVEALVHADGQLNLFEFALEKMIHRHLAPHFREQRQQKVRFLRICPVAPSCSVLLSALAHVGQDKPEAVEAAFQRGGMTLGVPADELTLLTLAECDLARIEAALDEISATAEGIRNLVVNACIQTVSADGMIGIREFELVRAIADTLGCVIPPAIDSMQQNAQAQAG